MIIYGMTIVCICLILPEASYSRGSTAAIHDQEMKILVTGAAGFIGFHLTKHLTESRPYSTIVAIDNFKPSYEPRLKEDRAIILLKMGVNLLYGDVCDEVFIRYLFETHEFSNVIHLAGETGVRRSVQQPQDFANSNIGCFVQLLELIVPYKVHIVYASSSTVYGPDSSLPFDPTSAHGSASNMYALSKMVDEMFADAYCRESNTTILGLRFFTVYGPWGRPDMAVYKYAHNLATGKKIHMAIHDSDKPAVRDFTYIDDIISGITMAMAYHPDECGEIFNLGYSEPHSLEELLQILKVEMGIKEGYVEYVPLSPYELPITHADIRRSRERLNFAPTTNLTKGIHKFVKWFWEYTSQEQSKQEKAILDEMLDYSRNLKTMIVDNNIKELNRIYNDRLTNLRKYFREFADREGIPVPPRRENIQFIFKQGLVPVGLKVMYSSRDAHDREALTAQCAATEVCVAVTTDGHFFSDLKPESEWEDSGDPSIGVYLADIDVCAFDLHHCPKHSTCVSEGSATYHCVCHEGFGTAQCLRLYSVEAVDSLQKEEEEEDYLNGADRLSARSGKEFVFFQGVDSVTKDGDILYISEEVDIDKMKEICKSLRSCIAFNTNGYLKRTIQPPSLRPHWSGDLLGGLYILDFDYCSLSDSVCPPESSCQKEGAGEYQCVCRDPLLVLDHETNKCVRATTEEHVTDAEEHVADTGLFKDESSDEVEVFLNDGPFDDTIHVIMSVDGEYWIGLVTAINSILQHASQPHTVSFHVVLSGAPPSFLQSYLQCFGFTKYVDIEIAQMDPTWLKSEIKIHSDTNIVGNLASMGNYARFYFDRLFPNLKKAIYLDSDIIVQHDIKDLWREVFTSEYIVTAVERKSPTYGELFSLNVHDLFVRRYGYLFGSTDSTFNAGIFGVNLELWVKEGVTKEVEYWMEENSRDVLWQYGTQPLMLLSLHSKWGKLTSKWNRDGLGWNSDISEKQLQDGYILHWSGKGKPWLDYGLYKSKWLKWMPIPCRHHGQCVADDTQGLYKCVS